MVKTKTEQAIIDALEAVAPQHDVDIVDVELVGATKAPCVRVRIEGAEGQSLSLNDVTANTKWVGDVIEELDPISSSYTLEVSSPGMARPLRRPCDFARFMGEDCELTSTATETNVTLELEDGESVTLDFTDVKKCKLKPTYDFKPAKEGK
jgi:ribosome maturation factor RimP